MPINNLLIRSIPIANVPRPVTADFQRLVRSSAAGSDVITPPRGTSGTQSAPRDSGLLDDARGSTGADNTRSSAASDANAAGALNPDQLVDLIRRALQGDSSRLVSALSSNTSALSGISGSAAQSALDPTVADAAWMASVGAYDPSAFASADPNATHPLLALADQLGVPRSRALSDILTAMGAPEAAAALAAEGDPLMSDIVNLLLEHGDALDLDTVSFLLKLCEEMSRPLDERAASAARKQGGQAVDRTLAMLQALSDKLGVAMESLMLGLERFERTSSALGRAMGGHTESLRGELMAMQYQTQLSELRHEARGFASNPEENGQQYLTQDEVDVLVDDMRSLQGPGNERPNTVTLAEWNAAVSGIRGAPGVTAEERVVMLDQLATELLGREHDADPSRALTIDDRARSAIEAAADGAPEDTELPEDAAPVTADAGADAAPAA